MERLYIGGARARLSRTAKNATKTTTTIPIDPEKHLRRGMCYIPIEVYTSHTHIRSDFVQIYRQPFIILIIIYTCRRRQQYTRVEYLYNNIKILQAFIFNGISIFFSHIWLLMRSYISDFKRTHTYYNIPIQIRISRAKYQYKQGNSPNMLTYFSYLIKQLGIKNLIFRIFSNS